MDLYFIIFQKFKIILYFRFKNSKLKNTTQKSKYHSIKINLKCKKYILIKIMWNRKSENTFQKEFTKLKNVFQKFKYENVF